MSERHPISPEAASRLADPAGQPPADTLVLALGNPLRGDDGVGSAILAQLAQSALLPAGVQVADGGSAGVDIALLVQGYRRVIIVDAADIGCAPGAWRRFTPQAIAPTLGDGVVALHSLGLGEALRLCEALQMLPPEIVIYGVQPQAIGWQLGLSEPVRRAIPSICQVIAREAGMERKDHGKNSGS